MQAKRSYRLAAFAGIVLAVMMIVAFVLDIVILTTTGGDPAFDLNNLAADLARAQGNAIWRIEAWIYVLLVVPFSVFAAGAYWALQHEGDRGLPVIGLMTTTLFWLFSTAHNAAIVAVVTMLLPDYAAGTPDGQLVEATARGLMSVGNTFFVPGGGVGTLLLVIGMAANAGVTFGGGQLPRWTGYVAIASAAFSLLGYLQFVSSALFPLALVGYILYIVWILGASIRINRLQ